MACCTTVRWIYSPAERVFAALRDIHLYPTWFASVRQAQWQATPLRAVGERGTLLSGRHTLDMQICDYAEGRLIAFDVQAVGRLTRDILQVEPTFDGTRVTYTSELVTLLTTNPQVQGRMPFTKKLFDDLLSTLKTQLDGAPMPAASHTLDLRELHR